MGTAYPFIRPQKDDLSQGTTQTDHGMKIINRYFQSCLKRKYNDLLFESIRGILRIKLYRAEWKT